MVLSVNTGKKAAIFRQKTLKNKKNTKNQPIFHPKSLCLKSSVFRPQFFQFSIQTSKSLAFSGKICYNVHILAKRLTQIVVIRRKIDILSFTFLQTAYKARSQDQQIQVKLVSECPNQRLPNLTFNYFIHEMKSLAE